jgi:hypothetical protein
MAPLLIPEYVEWKGKAILPYLHKQTDMYS